MADQIRQHVVLITVALCALSICAGCVDASHQIVSGSGRIAKERRDVRGFKSVALYMAGDLEIEIGSEETLWIEAEDNLLPYIETEVVDGVLKIMQRGRVCIRSRRPIRLHLTMRKLDQVIHAGPGRIQIPMISSDRLYILHSGSGCIDAGILEVGTLSVHASGSGDIELDHTLARRCRLNLSGSGEIIMRRLVGLSNEVRLTGSGNISVLEGSVVKQSAFLSASGDFEGAGLLTGETELMVSGSGSASVHANDLLDATVTGQGDIYYYGNPEVIRSNSGSGKIKRIKGWL